MHSIHAQSGKVCAKWQGLYVLFVRTVSTMKRFVVLAMKRSQRIKVLFVFPSNNMTSTLNNPPREEFSAKLCESTIYLGNYKNKDHKIETYKETMLTHDRACNTSVQANASQGLSQTRFHKGFNRRQQSSIDNPGAGSAKTDAIHKEERQKAIASIRKEYIKTQDVKTGYDIITGAPKGRGPVPTRMTGPKLVGDGLGPEAPQRGKNVLRESGGRFFTPLGSGHNYEHRQNVLYKEGLLRDKHCGVLEACKGDMKSYGLEDQFSKSEYTKNSAVTRTGLYETRTPGKFTPRKIENHPAGNPAIVQQWTTSIDLNNRTLSGHV